MKLTRGKKSAFLLALSVCFGLATLSSASDQSPNPALKMWCSAGLKSAACSMSPAAFPYTKSGVALAVSQRLDREFQSIFFHVSPKQEFKRFRIKALDGSVAYRRIEFRFQNGERIVVTPTTDQSQYILKRQVLDLLVTKSRLVKVSIVAKHLGVREPASQARGSFLTLYGR